MTPDLVIFDCDGVLIDSEVISAQVLVEVAAETGLRFDLGYVRDHFQGRSFPTVAQSIRDGFGVTLPSEFEATYHQRLLARFETDLRPTKGIARLLDRLVATACVATSSSPPRAARSLAIAGLDRRLPRVFTASQVALGKPAPDLFLFAAREMGVPPSRCLVIEDSRPGLLAARAAGMEVALYAGGSHLADLDDAGLVRLFDIGPGLLPFRNWTDLAAAYPGLLAACPHLEPAP